MDNRQIVEIYSTKLSKYRFINLKEILLPDPDMNNAIKDISINESDLIKKFLNKKESENDLNFITKSTLHRSCYTILKLMGLKHIIDKSSIKRESLKNKINSSNNIIQDALRKHNLRPARLYLDNKSKELSKDEQFFKMYLDGINRVLGEFYGYVISPIKKNSDDYMLKEIHKFLIITDDMSAHPIYCNECQPYIIYSGYKKNINFKPQEYNGYVDNKNLDLDLDEYNNNDNFEFDTNIDDSDDMEDIEEL